jgi:hypothetical protein
VIRSFKEDETRKVFNRQWSSKLPKDMQNTAYRKLAMLHSANALVNLQSRAVIGAIATRQPPGKITRQPQRAIFHPNQ